MKYLLSSIVLVGILIVACGSKEKEQNEKLKASIERGAAVYKDFCVVCHGANGEGIAHTFPPLAKSDYLLNNRTESIRAIKFGQTGKIVVNGITYNNAMAPLGLYDEEIADVMNYITNSWTNKNDQMITVEEVAELKD